MKYDTVEELKKVLDVVYKDKMKDDPLARTAVKLHIHVHIQVEGKNNG